MRLNDSIDSWEQNDTTLASGKKFNHGHFESRCRPKWHFWSFLKKNVKKIVLIFFRFFFENFFGDCWRITCGCWCKKKRKKEGVFWWRLRVVWASFACCLVCFRVRLGLIVSIFLADLDAVEGLGAGQAAVRWRRKC